MTLSQTTTRKPRDRMRKRSTMSREELDALGVSTTIPLAGRAFGLARDAAYDLHKRGQFPCPVLQVGERFVVPVAGIRAALGLSDPPHSS